MDGHRSLSNAQFRREFAGTSTSGETPGTTDAVDAHVADSTAHLAASEAAKFQPHDGTSDALMAWMLSPADGTPKPSDDGPASESLLHDRSRRARLN